MPPQVRRVIGNMIEIGDSFDRFKQVKETINNLRYLNTIPYGGVAEFRGGGFMRPISVLPIAVMGVDQNLSFQNVSSYLQTVDFPYGQEISGYTSEGDTYFPITRADLQGLDHGYREIKLRNLSDQYVRLLQRNINNEDPEFVERVGRDTSSLLISEMVDNIDQHSKADNAYIFSQYYEGNDSCEICLVDNGIGIKNSLLDADRAVTSDYDALERVIDEHLSSKNEFGSQKRGTGIKNTINLLLNKELNGFFCIISGTVGYFVDSNNRDLFLDLQDVDWQGTIVNMGFRKPQRIINIYDYIR